MEVILKNRTLASCILGTASVFALLGCTTATFAARLVDVSIVNRSTGERLTPYRHGGRLYVAGTPGDRYAVELKGRQGERVLAVLSVDGINVLTGQTAATRQSGYVIDGGQRYGISGWRKSMDDVAQFVFTALPDSYAARTGRPGNVGVIGVAAYREMAAPYSPPVEPWRGAARPQFRDESARDGGDSAGRQSAAAPSALSSKAENGLAIADDKAPAAGALAEGRADQAESRLAARAESAAKSMKLGTGHGPREYSPTRYTEFARRSDSPDEIVTIYYDSRANLIARGIIPLPRLAEPSPFPAGGGFVPDPRG